MVNELILQLETSTSSCSVALSQNGNIISFKEQNERNIHASHITLFIEDAMNSAGKKFSDLSAVAISMGPGSYTGLRIGVSTAKGLCYALDIPLIAVNTLEAMASRVVKQVLVDRENTLLCPMIDARRMEVFTALYDYQLNEIEPVQAKIIDESSFTAFSKEYKIIFFGDGAEKCKAIFKDTAKFSFLDFINSALDLSQIALKKFRGLEFENVAYFEPYYLKDYMIIPPTNKNPIL